MLMQMQALPINEAIIGYVGINSFHHMQTHTQTIRVNNALVKMPTKSTRQ